MIYPKIFPRSTLYTRSVSLKPFNTQSFLTVILIFILYRRILVRHAVIVS